MTELQRTKIKLINEFTALLIAKDEKKLYKPQKDNCKTIIVQLADKYSVTIREAINGKIKDDAQAVDYLLKYYNGFSAQEFLVAFYPYLYRV